MFNHYGLYLTDEHVQAARKGRDRDPLKRAWAQLNEFQTSADLAAVLIAGFRYRFDDNTNAGMQAADMLYNFAYPSGSTLDTFMTMAAVAQSYELLRPLFSPDKQTRWLTDFEAHLSTLGSGAAYHEYLWREALRLFAGIVLDKPEMVEAGAETYRRAIREDIRPDGYIQGAVEGRDGQSYFRHVVSTQALVLMAEAAKHAGVDLWGYEQRGVSVVTAAAYPLYYYCYTAGWRWGLDLTEEVTQRALRAHGGFLEIVHHARPLHDIGLLLKDWRPLFDLYGGGFTTLSHGSVARRGLFG